MKLTSQSSTIASGICFTILVFKRVFKRDHTIQRSHTAKPYRILLKKGFTKFACTKTNPFFSTHKITLVRTCNYSVYDLLIYGLLVAFLVFVALKVQPKASPEYFTPFDDIEVKRYKSYCFFTYLDFALTFMTLISLFQFT